MADEPPLEILADDAARVLALLRPIGPARKPPPIAPGPAAEPSPPALPDPPAPALPIDPGLRRPRRDRTIPLPRSNRHALDPAAGRKSKGAQVPGSLKPIVASAFSRGAGIPTRQELLAASAELARRFHGVASTASNSYHAKQAAVAFSVMVDKLTLLKSEVAPELVPDEADGHRLAVARLAVRISRLLVDRAK